MKDQARMDVPSLTLPKGGGAIRGMGETFQPDSFSGTGSYSVPIHVTPARGHEPVLALNYNSGSGNGIFGAGFSLSLPAISRRTEKGIPVYNSTDVFVLSGNELVPEQVRKDGGWTRKTRTETVDGAVWTVCPYTPRIQANHDRIELWTHIDTGDTCWKIVSNNNVTAFYGRTPAGRIFDPANPSRIFEWLIEESVDAKGNRILYSYKKEDYDNVQGSAYEHGRIAAGMACSNAYIQNIRYGNYYDESRAEQFAFEVVFDYGERDVSDAMLSRPGSDPYSATLPWSCRQDAFSSYRSGFEIRTYRLCKNILMFHNFKKELGNDPCLVRCTALVYEESGTLSWLKSIAVKGCRRDDDGSYEVQKMPPLEFQFSLFLPPASPDFKALGIGKGTIPGYLDKAQFLPVDLYGEGLPGFLFSDASATFYLEPLGGGQYKAPGIPGEFPVQKNIQDDYITIADLEGDGQQELLVHSRDTLPSGYYERKDRFGWQNFKTFENYPAALLGTQVEMAGLCGNGRTDLLLVNEDTTDVHLSKGRDGYEALSRVSNPQDFPAVKRGDRQELVTFANVFGDGLPHRIRVASGCVECWPNLGYGYFGRKITLENAPLFDGEFDAGRIFLADIDGSGTADLIFVFADRVELYVNKSGNAFSEPVIVHLPESYTDIDRISFADIEGNGTSCLVFTKVTPEVHHYYYAFAGSVSENGTDAVVMKPYLLTGVVNNLGAALQIQYCSATKFYLEDKEANDLWPSPLPFPVQVVEQVTTCDRVSGTRLVNKFRYHDGCYDPVEKEFRGFGFVEAWDTETKEEYAAGSTAAARFGEKLYVSPVYTKTWYHTGRRIGKDTLAGYYRKDYYPGDSAAYNFPDNIFSDAIAESDAETIRQAHAALKGQTLRQETYGLDEGTPETVSANPYTVTMANAMVRLLQEKGNEPYAVFMVSQREHISYQYERNPDDPRVQQSFILETDDFGNVTRSCNVFLPRRVVAGSSTNVYPQQLAVKATAAVNAYINTRDVFQYIGVVSEKQAFEVSGLDLKAGNYCTFADVAAQVTTALEQQIPYEATPVSGTVQARLFEWSRILFWNEDQSDVLPPGQLSSKALEHHQEQAVFTKDLIRTAFDGRLTDEIVSMAGGYFFDDASGYWWNRGLVQRCYTDPACFYLRNQVANTFVAPSSSLYSAITLEYDEPYYFSPLKISRWLDAQASNDEMAVMDYMAMQVKQITGLNNNISQALFDPLGQVIASTAYGTVNGVNTGGMALYPDAAAQAGYQRRTVSATGAAITFADVLANPGYYLQGAATFFYYDLFAWMKGDAAGNLQPVCAVGLQRDNYYHTTAGTTAFSCQVTIVYADGFGRIAETRTETEPGPGAARDANGKIIRDAGGQPLISAAAGRWVVSGRTIYNNKGKPCAQYLPYFSSTPGYEDQQDAAAEAPAPPTVTHYDPLLRVIRVDTPKGFFTKMEFTPWEEKYYDENDTVLDSPYYADHYPGKLTLAGKDAIDKASVFYNTPATRVYDTMGNTFLEIQDNLGRVSKDAFENIVSGTSIASEAVWRELVSKGYLVAEDTRSGWVTPKFQPYAPGFLLELAGGYKEFSDSLIRYLRQSCLSTLLEYDITGRGVMSVDPRLHDVYVQQGGSCSNFRYRYAMGAKDPLNIISADAGTVYHFTNIYDKPVWSWTARNFNQTIAYDRLQRPVTITVKGIKDDGTIATDNLVEVFTYGETQAQPEDKNLRGQLYQHKDQSGIIVNSCYGLQEELLETSRQLTLEYKQAINWNADVALRNDLYQDRYTYDALKRLLSHTTPDGSVTANRYNRSGELDTIMVQYKDGASQSIVDHIAYDARKQRTKMVYANGSQTVYQYEDTTLRLELLKTTRTDKDSGGGSRDSVMQDIGYTYDPVGSVTRTEDHSCEVVFNNNQKVEPVSDYTYNALYRLIRASGRQHPGIAGNTDVNNQQSGDFKQSKFIALPDDVVKLENYTELYDYDESGNLVKTAHLATRGWTRQSVIAPDSNRIKTLVSSNGITGSQDLSYDRSGNQKQLFLNSTVNVTWSCCENLSSAIVIERPGELDDADYYTYDRHEIRTRKVSERMAHGGSVTRVEEKIYLGNYEEKRISAVTASGNTVTLLRQTLRIMDDRDCVAMIHYWVQDDLKTEADQAGTRKLRYQLGNNIGSVSMELDGDARLISYEEYFPYGGTSFVAGSNQREVALKEYRYSHKERDDSTGLYYYGARYYAPWLGRWLSADPAGTIDGLNLYAFVGGNPLSFLDMNGTTTVTPAVLQNLISGRNAINVARAHAPYAGNVTDDVNTTHAESTARLSVARSILTNVFADPAEGADAISRAASAIGAHGGACNEFSALTHTELISHVTTEPIIRVWDPAATHSFTLIGDPRATPANRVVVADAWPSHYQVATLNHTRWDAEISVGHLVVTTQTPLVSAAQAVLNATALTTAVALIPAEGQPNGRLPIYDAAGAVASVANTPGTAGRDDARSTRGILTYAAFYADMLNWNGLYPNTYSTNQEMAYNYSSSVSVRHPPAADGSITTTRTVTDQTGAATVTNTVQRRRRRS